MNDVRFQAAVRPASSALTVLAAAASLLLGACTSMAPDYQRPAAPVADRFPDAGVPPSEAGKTASDIEWQSYFHDERLKRLITLSLNNNRDLRVAALNIERARASFQAQRADLFPTVGLGVSANRQPNGNGGITSIYQAGIAVSAFELDLFGRIRSLSDTALAQFAATEEARKATQISLVSGVATAYLGLLADDELLEVTRQTLGTREESFKLTKLKFDNGAASELDLRQGESLLEGARVTLAQLTRQRAQDENALVLLLGQPLPADLPPGLPLAEQQLNSDLPAGLPSELLTRRPDVLQAEQQLRAANANIGAARAAFFPRITLTGSAGSVSNHLSDLFQSGSGGWTFAPQALLPIFDAGRNRANLAGAKVQRDIAVAQYERAIQSAFREVADALAGRATLGEQQRAQMAQSEAEQVRFRLADLRYRNGVSSYLDVLDAQRALFTAQQAVVQIRVAQAQNNVALYRVMGGGWMDPAQAASAPADAASAASAEPSSASGATP